MSNKIYKSLTHLSKKGVISVSNWQHIQQKLPRVFLDVSIEGKIQPRIIAEV